MEPLQSVKSQQFRLGYRPALDGIRAVAIIFVVGFHVIHAQYPNGRYPFSGGFIGVDLFFVLSGFLITTLLIQEWDRTEKIRLGNFYLRRILRLLPAQVLVLGTALALAGALFAATGNSEQVRETARAAAAVFFYVSNWVVAFDVFELGPLGPMWSLSIEEQFYILWPVVLLLMVRKRVSRRVMLVTVLAAAILSAGWRAVVFISTDSVDRAYYGLDTHADLLLFGCALALIATAGWLPATPSGRRSLAIASTAGAIVLLVALFALEYGDEFLFYGGYTLIGLAATAVVAQSVIGLPPVVGSWIASPPMRWIGKVSYGLYLWHYLVLYAVRRFGGVQTLGLPNAATAMITFILVAAGTAALAAASYYLVERRFLAMKPPNPTAAPAPAPMAN